MDMIQKQALGVMKANHTEAALVTAEP